jgi:hypothetical protein
MVYGSMRPKLAGVLREMKLLRNDASSSRSNAAVTIEGFARMVAGVCIGLAVPEHR